LATTAVCGQEVVSSTPQRVSGGVVQRQESVARQELPHLQSPLFRDTMPISRVSAISVAVPGFAQLYNNQYLKIPILYGSVGALTYLTVNANQKFQQYKRQYDFLQAEYYAISNEAGLAYREQFLHEQVDPVRTQMIKYNTQRTVYFAGAAFTYLYFLADGVLNHPHPTTTVKKATTLAMMFPGAGQLYNKSYWKVPIVIGTFATMGYLIDWNNRGFQRMRAAHKTYPNNEFQNWNNPPSKEDIARMRSQYRRNRDLCIILTGGVYLLSVIEAHVDAYLKNFDVSDDLTMRVEPTLMDMSRFYAAKNSSGYPGVGLSMKLAF
jgi:hypothetical protein